MPVENLSKHVLNISDSIRTPRLMHVASQPRAMQRRTQTYPGKRGVEEGTEN